jgi:hypothetical protein
VTELWLPVPDRDVARAVQLRIARFAERHGAVIVELELRDGSRFTITSLDDEPGGGFLTLVPHGDQASEVIVPIASIARITLSAASDEHPLGFALAPPT